MSEFLKTHCRRCGNRMVSVLALGHVRRRCPERRCEDYRQHRRAQQRRSATVVEQGPLTEPPMRPTVEEKQAFYFEPGQPGYEAALAEAKRLHAKGLTLEEIAEDILWPVEKLRAEIGVEQHQETGEHHQDETEAA